MPTSSHGLRPGEDKGGDGEDAVEERFCKSEVKLGA